jgi:hypothetical protein
VGGSGGEGVGQVAEMESTLALAENVYVNLPRPTFNPKTLFLGRPESTRVEPCWLLALTTNVRLGRRSLILPTLQLTSVPY